MNDATPLPRLDSDSIRAALAAHEPTFIEDGSLMPAAVLVPIVAAPDGDRILFTVRTARVEHHKGEVSFPGGARDAEDASMEQTAIRETYEEVGIDPSRIDMLGRLNDHQTRTGFHITPYVGVVPPHDVYDASRIEVNVVLEVPVRDLWDVYLMGPQEFTYGQNTVLGYEFHHDGHRIWGATAGILTEFFDILRANAGH